MRVLMMLLYLSVAGTCYAEDPLETLNTIEDTLATMQSNLKAQGVATGDTRYARMIVEPGAAGDAARAERLYFVSDQPLGTRPWATVTPCSEEGAASLSARESATCSSEGDPGDVTGLQLLRTRSAAPSDLQPGIVVVVQDKSREGWYLAKVTDTSEIGSGYVAISAPFKAQLRNVRVIE